MHDEVLDACRDGLAEAKHLVEALRFDPEQHEVHLHLPGALLARATFLTESALNISQLPERGVVGVLLRSAVEAWIDCCYTVYGREPAVLNLLQSKVDRERELASRMLPNVDVARFAEEQAVIDDVVAVCKERGTVPHDFAPNGSLNAHDRLLKAIRYAQSDTAFINVYRQTYAALSTLEVHPVGAIDMHATEQDDEFRFSVTPQGGVVMEPIIAQVTLLVLMASSELAKQSNLDAEPIGRATGALLEALQEYMSSAMAMIQATDDPEVKAALLSLLGITTDDH